MCMRGALTQPALVRARRTNGDFKAFVDSPSPLAGGMGLLNHFVGPYSTARAGLGTPALEPVLLRKGWKIFTDQRTATCWLAHPGSSMGPLGITHALLVSATVSQHSCAKLPWLWLLPEGYGTEIKCQIIFFLHSQLKSIRPVVWAGHAGTEVKTKQFCVPSTSRAELLCFSPRTIQAKGRGTK